MSSGPDGYDIDRFSSPPPTHLVCPVCGGVLNQPKQTPCEHVFCSKCILMWLNQGKTHCPVCRGLVTPSNLSPVSLVLRNILNDLQLRCEFEGCEQVVTVGNVEQHQSTCGHGPAKCANEGCPLNTETTSSTRAEIQAHEATCEFRRVACPNDCGETILFRDVAQHRNEACSLEPMQCQLGCGANVPRNQLEHHKETACTQRPVKCEVEGCSFEAPRGDEQAWETHNAQGTTAHTRCLMAVVDRLRREVSQLHLQVQSQQATMDMLRCVALGAHDSGVWVLRGVTSRWAQGFKEYSPTLSFGQVREPSLQYSFQLLVMVNTGMSRDHVGVFFIPKPGPNPNALAWPINNLVEMAVVNLCGGRNRTWTLSDHATKFFFQSLAPPPSNNTAKCGCMQLLTRNDVDSGEFVQHDAIVLRVRLMPQTFDDELE